MIQTFLLLTLIHIVGYFYMKRNQRKDSKPYDLKQVFFLSMVYFISGCIVILPVFTWELLVVVLLLSLIDLLIEVTIYGIVKQKKCEDNISTIAFFCVQQLIYILVVLMVSYLFFQLGFSVKVSCKSLLKFLSAWGIVLNDMNLYIAIKWLLLALVLHSPSNLFVSKFLEGFKRSHFEVEDPIGENMVDADIKAGRYIGTLE